MNIMLKQETLNTPFFSIIVNCHNSELYLREALNAALCQTFQDYELIVFDNASTDTTAIIAKSFGPDVCYYFSEVKLSLGAARNKAIMKAKGEYVAFLDSDDTWSLDKLAKQHAAISSNTCARGIGLCGSDAMRVSADLNPIAKYSMGRIVSSGNVIGPLLHECFIPMSSAVVNREICLNIGGFNEDYNIIEDYELWVRIARSFDVVYLADCLANIRFHGSNTSNDYKLMHSEVRKMFTEVHLWGDIETSVILSGSLAWELRYKVVNLFDLSDGNILRKIENFFKLLLFVIKNPRVFLSFAKRYMSVTLIRFAIIKYFRFRG